MIKKEHITSENQTSIHVSNNLTLKKSLCKKIMKPPYAVPRVPFHKTIKPVDGPSELLCRFSLRRTRQNPSLHSFMMCISVTGFSTVQKPAGLHVSEPQSLQHLPEELLLSCSDCFTPPAVGIGGAEPPLSPLWLWRPVQSSPVGSLCSRPWSSPGWSRFCYSFPSQSADNGQTTIHQSQRKEFLFTR